MSHRLKKVATVYKKVYWHNRLGERYHAVAMLCLPRGTRVRRKLSSVATLETEGDFKNRADRAKVLKIKVFASGKKIQRKRAFSGHDHGFIYTVGKTVRPDYFDTSSDICGGGIHFFQTYDKARHY